jgi:hypothetical protein
MKINELFLKASRLGVNRITLALDPKSGHAVVAAEQSIKAPDGMMSFTQHQIAAATHDAAAMTMLHRAGLCARVVGPTLVDKEDGDLEDQ